MASLMNTCVKDLVNRRSEYVSYLDYYFNVKRDLKKMSKLEKIRKKKQEKKLLITLFI